MYTGLDGVEQETDYGKEEDFPMLLDHYLTQLLNLPDAGEFSMHGTGRIFREGPEVIIKYQSRATAYWDEGEEDNEWKNQFAAEELKEMGVGPLGDADVNATAYIGAAAENKKESAGELDQGMSDEYSGRRVLFWVE